ncbi:MAG TPA: TRAP transporter large permease [Rhizobiaceae bacterium]|nr:TRAP transporter large permease [Rhizobiaceae bacterium]
MSNSLLGFLGIVALFALLAIRIPVAFAMFLVGIVGVSILNGFGPAVSLLASESFTLASNQDLVVVPLFILMGNVATQSGMSRSLYDAAYAWIGQVRGGLASATVMGCAGFAALSGSSIATALTIGSVSLKEMARFKYNRRLATGVVAAGGTLGILIPPSTAFVIYAILTQQSIGRLFLAGVLPGLMLTGLFILAITLICWFMPHYGPPGAKTSFREKLLALAGALPILTIVLLTIGGLYVGLFSPIEAAAVGAALAILFGFVLRSLSVEGLVVALRDSLSTTATVMLILISAHILNPFIALTHIPLAVGSFLTSLDIGPYGILLIIILVYIVLGCFLEGFSMLVLTMPVFFPIVMDLGFDPIWYGVILVIVLEMAMISPPVGVNAFMVKSIAKDVPLSEIFIGILPFWGMMILAVLILMIFPQIALILPNTMIGS